MHRVVILNFDSRAVGLIIRAGSVSFFYYMKNCYLFVTRASGNVGRFNC